MELLRKENWWVWLIFFLTIENIAIFILGYGLKVYEKSAWYTKWQNWVMGFVLLVFPALIMLIVFAIQTTINVAKKLKVSGEETYGKSSTWILGFIIPVIGWLGIFIMAIYLYINILIQLSKGEGEKYI